LYEKSFGSGIDIGVGAGAGAGAGVGVAVEMVMEMRIWRIWRIELMLVNVEEYMTYIERSRRGWGWG